ncbi:jg15963 [Pararge aegeria aegeria]|uniref:Jg15963 protein n=1 Tax=Pararge aegeria aegeria TaxID=348720 RepID=A0A8S4R1J2_9NEOP|nr:jg15963 [Pararge aegeria aegeria]
MSCQQIHLQNVQPLQTQMQSQVLQGDMSQQLQITSHVILPPVPMFKQHLLTNTLQQQFYGQYEAYFKDTQCVVAKLETNVPMVNEKEIELKPETQIRGDSVDVTSMKKRPRNQIPNPNKWACNVRKLKHQRGEAYVSRRGKLVPERHVRNTKDCLKSCRYKCSERINDVDRQHIFKAFYSLNANEKKHFLLNTTERNYVKHNKLMDGNHKRKYSFKYFFLVRAVRYTVCKNFYLGTLAISQKPVYNVHLGKSEMNLPKPDGRGLSEASAHSLSTEVKDRVRKHIMSFNTIDSKAIKQFSRKKQYLESSLSIKQMYNMYATECTKDDTVVVKESMYRKIFKQEFNLHFKKDKTGQQLCCRCKGSIKKK